MRAFTYRARHRPNVVHGAGLRSARAISAGSASFRTACADRQPFFAVQAKKALVVHMPALPLQQDVQTAIPVAHPAFGQFLQAHPQFHLRITPRLIPVRSPPEAHGAAGSTFRHFKYILIVLNDFAAADRFHHFFLSASCSTAWSSVRSANSRFSLPFSSSSCFSRRISDKPIPA